MPEDLRVRKALQNHLRMGDLKKEAIAKTADAFEDVSRDRIRSLADDVYPKKKQPEMKEAAGITDKLKKAGDKVTGGKVSEWEGKIQEEEEEERVARAAPEKETGWPEDSQEELENYEEWTEKGKKRKEEMAKKESERKAQKMLPGPGSSEAVQSTKDEEDLAEMRDEKRKEENKWECTSCGHENPGKTSVCEVCGQSREKTREMQEEEEEEEGGGVKGQPAGVNCPKCGSENTKLIEEGKAHCNACGNDFSPGEKEEASATKGSFVSRHGIIFAVSLSFVGMLPSFVFGFSWKWIFLWLSLTFFGMERIFT